MTESQTPDRRQITVRRAPKFGIFLALGVLLAFVVALILTLSSPESAEHSRTAVLGFFTVVLVLPGVAVGAVTWLLLDRISVRRSREATVEAVDEGPDETSHPS